MENFSGMKHFAGPAVAPLGDSGDSGIDGVKEKARAKRAGGRLLPAAVPEPFNEAWLDGAVLRAGGLRGRVHRGDLGGSPILPGDGRIHKDDSGGRVRGGIF